jgi:hypothetical protein
MNKLSFILGLLGVLVNLTSSKAGFKSILESDSNFITETIPLMVKRSYEDTLYHSPHSTQTRFSIETISNINWLKIPFRLKKSSEETSSTEGNQFLDTVKQHGETYKIFDPTQSIGSVYGEVGKNNGFSRIMVAFHGSYWLEDWLHDLLFLSQDSLPTYKVAGKVHTGFHMYLNRAYGPMMHAIKKLYTSLKIHLKYLLILTLPWKKKATLYKNMNLFLQATVWEDL